MKYVYICGPTVYNKPHIGNLKPIITFDLFNRSSKFLNIETNIVHNITDIDDKIIQKANEEKVSEKEISEKYTNEYFELLRNYNVLSPDLMPKVTEKIDLIIKFIEKLISKEAAYVVNGNVYFDVTKDSMYGTLSNRNIESNRYEESEDKKHPADFALWKNTKEGITFESPWSNGRPGWHTECAAFIDELPADTLFIHGGGVDLIFPHHENEAAQYRMANDKEITEAWKHVGQLSISGDKMSKSLGNVILAETFADEADPDVLRYIFLSTSVTGPIDVNDKLIEQSTSKIAKFKSAFVNAQLLEETNINIDDIAKSIIEFNFAEANKLINEELKEFNKTKQNASNIIAIMELLGFNFSKNRISEKEREMIKDLEKLRENKEYDKADSLKNELEILGII